MRRDSRTAAAFSEALSTMGVKVAARRFERWSADGLGPADAAPFDAQVGHYACLAHLSTSGRDADAVALRLAARGYPCDRLRNALLRRMGIETLPLPTRVITVLPTISTEEISDPVFSAIENVAVQIQCQEQPRLFAKLLVAMRQNALKYAPTVHERPEDLVHSVLVSMGWLTHGGGCIQC